MGVRTNLLTNQSYIDGVLVTPENENELKLKMFNRQASGILSAAYGDVQYLWRGIEDFPARTELLEKIASLIQELGSGEYKHHG